MPTAYTSPVQTGEISELAPFALRCARAWAATVSMRDDPLSSPIPEQFEPRTDYYDTALAAAKSKLASLEQLTPDGWAREYRAAHKAAMLRDDEREERRLAERGRYQDMIAKVRAWEPHDGAFKSFMLEQLALSIDNDCSPTPPRWREATDWPGVDAWCAKMRKGLSEDIQRYQDEIDKEVQRTKERNAWIAGLRAALSSGVGRAK